MTRRNPDRPPGPSYYRLPEASWTMIRDEYLSGWTAKEIAAKWRVSPTSVYRHAADGGWGKYARGQAFHDQVVAEAGRADAAAPRHAAPRYSAPLFEDVDLPRLWREEEQARRRAEEAQDREDRRRRYDPMPPPGYGPAPDFVQERFRRGPSPSEAPPALPAEDDPPPAETAERLAAAAGRAALEGRYDDAQKLARLAESLRKIAPAPAVAKPARAAPVGWTEENEEDEPPVRDRPLDCTINSCAVHRIYKEAEAALDQMRDRCFPPESADLVDWTSMAEAVGARIDPEVADLVQVFRAEGFGALQGRVLANKHGKKAAYPN